VELRTWPELSTATQRETDGQSTEFRVPPGSIVVDVQAPEVGSVDTWSVPPPSLTARQSAIDGHTMLCGSHGTVWVVHVPAPGSVVVCMSYIPGPSSPLAAQKVVVGQDPA
jgi:hypothetical protein